MSIVKNDKIESSNIVFNDTLPEVNSEINMSDLDSRFYELVESAINEEIKADSIKLKKYTISMLTNPSGYGTAYIYKNGTAYTQLDYEVSTGSQSYTIGFTPASSRYKFESWSKTGGSSSSISGGTLTISGKCFGDISITANAKLNAFIATVISDGNGTVSGNTQIPYEYSTSSQTKEITATCTPYNGYKFNIFSLSDTSVGSISGRTLTIYGGIAKDFNIIANFIANTYSISKATGVSGGSKTTYTYSPSSPTTSTGYSYSRTGYTFSEWNPSQGSMSGSGSSGTLTIPAGTYGDITVDAIATANTYSISAGSGISSITTPHTYTYGSSTSRTVTASSPSTGYQLDGFTATSTGSPSSWDFGVSSGLKGTLSIGSSYYGNITVKARTSAIEYSVTIKSNGYGTISGTKTYYYTYSTGGQYVDFTSTTFSPSSGYELVKSGSALSLSTTSAEAGYTSSGGYYYLYLYGRCSGNITVTANFTKKETSKSITLYNPYSSLVFLRISNGTLYTDSSCTTEASTGVRYSRSVFYYKSDSTTPNGSYFYDYGPGSVDSSFLSDCSDMTKSTVDTYGGYIKMVLGTSIDSVWSSTEGLLPGFYYAMYLESRGWYQSAKSNTKARCGFNTF